METAPRKPSRTAVMTAVGRALHREMDESPILDDGLAFQLAGEQGPGMRERLVSELEEPVLRTFSRWTCVRARVPEDLVERAMADGIGQYVILGAGLDSFAYRRADLMRRLRVFEVDHPASQAWKPQRLAELGMAEPEGVVYAAVDFEHQTLREGLERAGLDFSAPAVFSWIGVTMYLTQEAIEATLATVMEGAPKSRIVMTYDRPQQALSGLGLAAASKLQAITRELGEPMISLFEPAAAEQLLQRMGFQDVAHFGPEEAVQTYFAGRPDVRFGGGQRLILGTVPAGGMA